MPDRLDALGTELRSIADHGARGARGLPTAEVRRRGARRRATRAVASAVTVLLLVVGGAAVVAGSDSDDRVTGPPASRGAPAPGGLPPDVLPATMTYRTGSTDLRWEPEDSASTEEGREAVSVCQRATLASLGATDVRLRTYTWVVQLQPGQVQDQSHPDPDLGAIVAQFPDPAAGRAAYRAVGDWIEGCEANEDIGSDPPASAPVERFSSVDVPGGRGWTALVVYEEEPSVDPDAVVIDAHAVGISKDGTRVVLLSERQLGQDYNAPPDQAPITVRLEQVLETMGRPGSSD